MFGVPLAHEDDPERAVRAALRLVDALTEADLDIQVRIGVNTGEALVHVGVDPNSGQGFATGDALNTAARIEAAAPTMGVAVGALTHAATASVFVYEELEPIVAKGKAEPVALWLAQRTGPRPSGELTADATPFLGRASELGALIEVFDRSRASASVEFATIVAEPGIGKSRLVREFARHVEVLPELVTWLIGRCLPYGDGIGFWALGEIITPVTAACGWNSAFAWFQCNIPIPVLTHKGSSYPYQITASENLTGSPLTVPPYTGAAADANPETVYFRSGP